LAVLAEAKLVAGFWWRAGHSSCASNVVAFTLDLLDDLPSFIRLRVVRADSGFCLPEWLDRLEQQRLHYSVVARPLQPLQRLLRQDERSAGHRRGRSLASGNQLASRRGGWSCCVTAWRRRSGPAANAWWIVRAISIRRW
jgi:hypothetical protein